MMQPESISLTATLEIDLAPAAALARHDEAVAERADARVAVEIRQACVATVSDSPTNSTPTAS